MEDRQLVRIVGVQLADEELWQSVIQDRKYWRSYRELPKNDWEKHVERCRQLDDALRRIYTGQPDVWVISQLSWFSHRGVECLRKHVDTDYLAPIQGMLQTEFRDFFVTAHVWNCLPDGDGVGFVAVFPDRLVVLGEPLSPNARRELGLPK